MVNRRFKGKWQYMDEDVAAEMEPEHYAQLRDLKRVVEKHAGDFDKLLADNKITPSKSRNKLTIALAKKLEHGQDECVDPMIAKSLLINILDRNEAKFNKLKRKQKKDINGRVISQPPEVKAKLSRISKYNKEIVTILDRLDKKMDECVMWLNDKGDPEFTGPMY